MEVRAGGYKSFLKKRDDRPVMSCGWCNLAITHLIGDLCNLLDREQ